MGILLNGGHPLYHGSSVKLARKLGETRAGSWPSAQPGSTGLLESPSAFMRLDCPCIDEGVRGGEEFRGLALTEWVNSENLPSPDLASETPFWETRP